MVVCFIFPGMVVHKDPLHRPVGQMGDGEQWWCLGVHGYTDLIQER